ncbi:MAG: helix-turn-helix transcriptional regulator [Dehalococcoidia bacterium]
MEDLAVGSSLELLSAPRRVLLQALKEGGEATTEQLANSTFLSPGAVRQHLLALTAQGLVSYVRVREGPGRPRHVFRLTAHGEELFPQLYSRVANIILAAVEQEDPDVADRILARLLHEQLETAKETVQSTSKADRLLEVAKLVERYGFIPKLEVMEDAPAVLTLRHCPLIEVAAQHPRLCEVECEALKSVLPGASVTRTAHRLDGDDDCRYEIALGAE